MYTCVYHKNTRGLCGTSVCPSVVVVVVVVCPSDNFRSLTPIWLKFCTHPTWDTGTSLNDFGSNRKRSKVTINFFTPTPQHFNRFDSNFAHSLLGSPETHLLILGQIGLFLFLHLTFLLYFLCSTY